MVWDVYSQFMFSSGELSIVFAGFDDFVLLSASPRWDTGDLSTL